MRQIKKVKPWWWEWGEGRKVVVLVHGWGRDKTDWLRLVPFLRAKKYRWVLVDLPGFGSWRWKEKYNKWDSWRYAEWLEWVIREMGGEKVSLVGHSWGGKIGVILAARRPELVEKLVLLAPKVWGEGRWWYGLLALVPEKLKKWGRRYLGKWWLSDDDLGAGERRELFKQVVKEDARAEARRVRAKSLLIWGKDDEGVRVERGRELRELMKKSEWAEYVGDHFFWQAKPKLIARRIERFLDE